MATTLKTPTTVNSGLYKEKGSKFLAFALPFDNVDELKAILNQYKKEHHKAKHICFAYRIGAKGENFRANDNGEPPGTAGRPILRQIEAANLTNILVVVVRYFGGTLLGTGGLCNAYKTAANEAVTEAAKTAKDL
ncbi:MAG: YigZ family protein [Paludibacteraceae bacterium]|nr:YigZ family protein [Paludibacteraceae bacterium]